MLNERELKVLEEARAILLLAQEEHDKFVHGQGPFEAHGHGRAAESAKQAEHSLFEYLVTARHHAYQTHYEPFTKHVKANKRELRLKLIGYVRTDGDRELPEGDWEVDVVEDNAGGALVTFEDGYQESFDEEVWPQVRELATPI